jgi:hypothetical protein
MSDLLFIGSNIVQTDPMSALQYACTVSGSPARGYAAVAPCNALIAAPAKSPLARAATLPAQGLSKEREHTKLSQDPGRHR